VIALHAAGLTNAWLGSARPLSSQQITSSAAAAKAAARGLNFDTDGAGVVPPDGRSARWSSWPLQGQLELRGGNAARGKDPDDFLKDTAPVNTRALLEQRRSGWTEIGRRWKARMSGRSDQFQQGRFGLVACWASCPRSPCARPLPPAGGEGLSAVRARLAQKLGKTWRLQVKAERLAWRRRGWEKPGDGGQPARSGPRLELVDGSICTPPPPRRPIRRELRLRELDDFRPVQTTPALERSANGKGHLGAGRA